MIWKNNMDMV